MTINADVRVDAPTYTGNPFDYGKYDMERGTVDDLLGDIVLIMLSTPDLFASTLDS